jgi:hypothetical protein
LTQRSFEALLAELFRAVGEYGARATPGVGQCRCNGFDVAIYYDEHADPSHLHAYIDVGAVPAVHQREVFRVLLQRQLQLAPPHQTVVGLDASGSIVLVARIAFDAGLTGARLADVLRRLIRQARIWRSGEPSSRLPSGRRGASRRPS